MSSTSTSLSVFQCVCVYFHVHEHGSGFWILELGKEKWDLHLFLTLSLTFWVKYMWCVQVGGKTGERRRRRRQGTSEASKRLKICQLYWCWEKAEGARISKKGERETKTASQSQCQMRYGREECMSIHHQQHSTQNSTVGWFSLKHMYTLCILYYYRYTQHSIYLPLLDSRLYIVPRYVHQQ